MEIKELISKFLGDSLTDMLKKGSDKIADEISHMVNNRILEYLTTEFKSNYKTKTLLYKVEPIELEKFYQPLYLRRVEQFKRFSSIYKPSIRIGTEHLKDLFDKDKDKNCITIVGTAGSGKSTLVKYLFVDCIREKYKIPIKIELRYLNKYKNDLQSYISDEIIKFNKIAEKENILEKLLNSGEFVFFFDGYDEINSNKKEEITRDISKITKRYNKNDYLLTSRPFANIEMLDNFYNYEICDLEPDEINSFIRKQFSNSEKESAENIIKTIENNKNKNDAYNSFLKNPLLLSMFILACNKDSYIPEKKSEYYNNVFDALYSGHDTLAKLGYVREKESGLSKEDIINLLKHFSIKSFFEQEYNFSLKYFEEIMNECKGKLGLKFDTEKLLRDLIVAIGILTKDGLEITFPHRSLQEYFAALFVTKLDYENKLEFYISFSNSIINRFTADYIYGNANFISLLKEMDSINYYKQFEIPLLKSFHTMIDIYDVYQRFTKIPTYISINYMKSDFAFVRNKYEFKEALYNFYENAMVLQVKWPLSKKLSNSFHKSIDELITVLEKDINNIENEDSKFIKKLMKV